MAADEGIAAQREFEVDTILRFFASQCRVVKGFGDDIEEDVAIGDFHGGQADAADTNGIAPLYRHIGQFRQRNGKLLARRGVGGDQ